MQYAPIRRSYTQAISNPECKLNQKHVEQLKKCIDIFGMEDAEVLEYWLDASMFSNWKRPSVKLPFLPEVLATDLAFYAKQGFKKVSTFGTWLDKEYVEQYSIPPVKNYGKEIDHE